jgi:preprotein translocase subunit YajC
VFALAWLVVLAGVFYFLIWRPQQRRVATMRALQSSLELGDEVVTTGGVYGKIRALRDEHVELEIAPGVVVKVARGAIGTRVTGEPTETGGDTDADTGADTDAEHPDDTEGAA